MKMLFGRLLHWLGFPLIVRPMRYYHNGLLVEITGSPFYTKLKVNETEFFFNRESGKYDGFGRMEGDALESAKLERLTTDSNISGAHK